ncbi:MAG: hypothetical protein KAU83_06125 [Bacteroidales bacterium]|nr:hypothetical protein [Bacteroidales bacterium]
MQKNIRQLAVVMFTDMVGYTALMQEDEDKARKNRERHRKVLERSIQEHHGLILQYYGDGTLSVFGSVIEAIECAVEIQQELQKEPKIPLRIGMHVGDIVYSDDGIYGDAVNIASRIENLSVPGGVLISDKVYDEIKNHHEFSTTTLGEFELKNVKRPVELFAVTNEGLQIPTKKALKSSAKTTIKTIAVLPFVNMSADPENEYFSEGIAEEIINALTKIEGLNVTARTSSFAMKGKDIDIREAGKILGVLSILEGSVRKAGNKVRITAQLINTNDGFHIFSEEYDRELQDIFTVQDEISLMIANKFRENLEGPPKKELTEKPPTENLEAYDLYLKGRYHLYEGSMEGVKKSQKYFEKAIELAPDFALPYTGLSTIFSHYSAFRTMEPDEAYTIAKKYALKSLEIDDTLVVSHLALAQICFVNEWDFKKTHELINKSMHLNPGNAEVHSWSSILANVEGKLDEAMMEAKISMSLDPLSQMSSYVLGVAYLTNERYTKAIEQFDKTLQKHPFAHKTGILKAESYLELGEFDKAIEIFNNIPISPERVNVHWGAIGYAYSKKGEMKKVHECLEKIKEQEKAGTDEFLNWSYTLIYLALNETDKMFKYLDKSLKEKVPSLLFIKVDPIFKPFRNDPRFINLMVKTFGSD